MKYVLLLLGLLGFLEFSNAQNFEWVKQIGGLGNETQRGMHVDAAGNVYLTGNFTGITDLDPGPGVANHAGSNSNAVFVAKYDNDGLLVWSAHFYAGNYNNIGYDITTDASGNVYCVGTFFGTGHFDPGGTDTTVVSNGQHDACVVKYNASGNFEWVRTVGGSGQDRMLGVVDQANGNIVVAGVFNNTVDMDPGPNTLNFTSTSAFDIFFSEFTAQGDLVYAKQLPCSANILIDDIAKDVNDNVLLCGYFGGSVDFDPGAGNMDITSVSGSDGYIAKYDGDGNLQFAKSFPTDGWGEVYSIATDSVGNVYGTGAMQGNTNFDVGVSDTTLFSNADGGYVIKLDGNGSFDWITGFPSDVYIETKGINVDNMGRPYITGIFENSYDFSQSVNGDTITSAGSYDAYLLKLDQDGSYLWTRQFSGVDAVDARNISVDSDYSIFVAGIFEDLVDFNLETGPDTLSSQGTTNPADIFLLKISQCAPQFYTDTLTACDSLVWSDGNTYMSDTLTEYALYTTPEGCDSLVRLDLTVNYASSGTDVISACDSYTWIDGNTYTSSNATATFTLNNATGCDSVVTLNLTINTTPSASIAQNGNQLEASPPGLQYQWVECPSFTELMGETNATFNASNGEYAVIIDDAGCVDTSACFVYSDLGIATMEDDEFSVYPNPSNGFVTIEHSNPEVDFKIEVLTVSGQVVYQSDAIDSKTVKLNAPSGTYFLQISTAHSKSVRKLIVL